MGRTTVLASTFADARRFPVKIIGRVRNSPISQKRRKQDASTWRRLVIFSNFTQASQVALVQTINSRFRAPGKFNYDREIAIFRKMGVIAPLQT